LRGADSTDAGDEALDQIDALLTEGDVEVPGDADTAGGKA
jgi:hypothetical protein